MASSLGTRSTRPFSVTVTFCPILLRTMSESDLTPADVRGDCRSARAETGYASGAGDIPHDYPRPPRPQHSPQRPPVAAGCSGMRLDHRSSAAPMIRIGRVEHEAATTV